MKHPHRFSTALGCAAALFFLTGARPAAQDAAVPFKVGEVLTYDVGYSTYLTAGTATLSVTGRKPVTGGSAYDFVAEGRPTTLLARLYHLYYKAESLLNTRTLRPAITTVFSDERGRQKLRTMTFTGPTSMEFQPRANEPKEKKTIPAGAQDPLSAMYVLRALKFTPGQVVRMPVVDGGDIMQVRFTIGGVEQIKTPIGTLPAWRITPTITDLQNKPVANRQITMWISTDARRLPLKLEAALAVGNFTLTLAKVSG
jgi:hypothetical protein